MIITITGDEGSGKSTIAKLLAKKLNLDHYYMGKIRREAAKAKNMTLAEYNCYGEQHPETDYEVDEYQKQLGKTQNNFIVEGRTSWFLIPGSTKIYFKVDPREGAKRVFAELQKNNHRNEDKNLQTIEDVIKSHQKRRTSDQLRYQKYYSKDCFAEENFDLILDTTNLTPKEVLTKTLEHIKK